MGEFNGTIIMTVLKQLGDKAPMGQLIKKVADALKKPVDSVRDTIMQTVEGGVQLGYLQRQGNYIIASSLTNDMKLKDRPVSPRKKGKKRNNNPRGKKRKPKPKARKKKKR
ncbi:uncharacterized protein LOC119688892 [Teleopsis dalmanni]|uniref:uncharacterized protein LOC119688892 n=1 Tax=Teleopsis dalmanni TaxID=139649 RepID=UPI0018CE4CAD|nr:uncharacterized protein LOC119688892 [Teleopsis dalmanni]